MCLTTTFTAFQNIQKVTNTEKKKKKLFENVIYNQIV